MTKSFVMAPLLLASLANFAQLRFFAPDLRWNDEWHSFVGFANPWNDPLTISIVGYDADGALLGETELTLGRFSRVEMAAHDLFETEDIAWLEASSALAPAGYVRYASADGLRFSMVPLNPFAGGQLHAAQLTPLQEDGFNQFTLVNTSPADGAALLTPLLQGKYDKFPIKAETPVALPNFGAALGQTSFDYPTAYDKAGFALFWDTIEAQGGIAMAGVQHFGSLDGSTGHASVNLPRTTKSDIIVTPWHAPEDTGFDTGFILVNTFPTTLPVRLTAYYEIEEPQILELELAPFEKRTLRFNDHSQIVLPFNALWYRITPLEAGLIGFQTIVPRSGGGLAAVEAEHIPANTVHLPYTPNNAELETRLTIVNTGDIPGSFLVAGFNDEGRIVSIKTGFGISARKKASFTTREIFGARANLVTWCRVASNDGMVAAFALVSHRTIGEMAAMQGIPSGLHRGNVYRSDLEQFGMINLLGQGWRPYMLGDRGIPVQFQNYRNHFHDEHNYPEPGQFFMETAFKGNTGDLYLGYEPIPNPIRLKPADDFKDDAVAFASPFFEVPNFGEYYLSYHMRFFDPQHATKNSRYGLLFREEGSDQWTWFGLLGKTLLNPPTSIGDCWLVACYRSHDNEITYSDWLPFEIKLPDSFRGKRMQVALFYHHIFEKITDFRPTLFIDDLRLSADPLPYANFFNDGFGILAPEE